jgi:hypothetical protein
MKPQYPEALRALYQTKEDRLEELQQELYRIQDEIFLLTAGIRPERIEATNE